MSRWNRTCYEFKYVRKMIDEDIETTEQCFKIMYGLEACCDELTPDRESEWEFYEEFRDFKSEIHDDIELMDEDDYESCEETVNGWLYKFYELCDFAGVWLRI